MVCYAENNSDCACAIKIPIASGRVNIRIHRDIEGKMWFGVGVDIHNVSKDPSYCKQTIKVLAILPVQSL